MSKRTIEVYTEDTQTGHKHWDEKLKTNQTRQTEEFLQIQKQLADNLLRLQMAETTKDIVAICTQYAALLARVQQEDADILHQCQQEDADILHQCQHDDDNILQQAQEKQRKLLASIQDGFAKEMKSKMQVINWLSGSYSVEK